MRFSLAAAALVPVLSASAADILVLVGANGKLEFSPQNISANVGDNIQFQFQAKNHSVTQSTFANPCSIQTTPAQGIDSGFQFVAPNATELPQWSFTVDNASTPLWFFCAQTIPTGGTHCQSGMVFSVNANEASEKNFAAYKAAAMASNGAAAGGSAPAGGAAPSGGSAPAGGASQSASGSAPGSTDSAGAGANTPPAGGAAPTDGANAIGGSSPSGTDSAGAPPSSTDPVGASGNSTNTPPPNAGVRVGGSTMTLVTAIGLAAGLLL